MNPTLEGSKLRIKRAGDHIYALGELEKELVGIDPTTIPTEPAQPPEVQPDGSIATFSPGFRIPDLPTVTNPLWSIVLGEAVYNLRAALDYLIYSLAHLDSGQEQDGTQFPICTKTEYFQDEIRKGHLRGLDSLHVTAIERLQPYPSGHWLQALRDISNPDKHRHLISTLSAGGGTIEMSGMTIGGAQADVSEVNVKLHSARKITLGDGTPVIPLLITLQTQIADRVDQFQPCFERKSPLCPHGVAAVRTTPLAPSAPTSKKSRRRRRHK